MKKKLYGTVCTEPRHTRQESDQTHGETGRWEAMANSSSWYLLLLLHHLALSIDFLKVIVQEGLIPLKVGARCPWDLTRNEWSEKISLAEPS